MPAVLREERQFRLLFAGQALSVVGDRMTAVVLPFAVLSIGGSANIYGKPAALDASYGRNPWGFTVFARLSLGR